MRALDIAVDCLRRVKNAISLQRLDDAEDAASSLVKSIFDDAPVLGLDLDGTIDEAPIFFKTLSRVWPGLVIIITCRSDAEKAHADAKRFGVHYDKLFLVRNLEDKAEAIRQHNVNVYVDDQDECLMDIPLGVTVLKIRNGGNFDSGRWLYSERTGELV